MTIDPNHLLDYFIKKYREDEKRDISPTYYPRYVNQDYSHVDPLVIKWLTEEENTSRSWYEASYHCHWKSNDGLIYLQRSLELDPDYMPAYLRIIEVYWHCISNDEKINYCEKILNCKEGNHIFAHYKLLWLYLKDIKDYAKGVHHLIMYRSLYHGDNVWSNNLVNLLFGPEVPLDVFKEVFKEIDDPIFATIKKLVQELELAPGGKEYENAKSRFYQKIDL